MFLKKIFSALSCKSSTSAADAHVLLRQQYPSRRSDDHPLSLPMQGRRRSLDEGIALRGSGTFSPIRFRRSASSNDREASTSRRAPRPRRYKDTADLVRQLASRVYRTEADLAQLNNALDVLERRFGSEKVDPIRVLVSCLNRTQQEEADLQQKLHQLTLRISPEEIQYVRVLASKKDRSLREQRMLGRKLGEFVEKGPTDQERLELPLDRSTEALHVNPEKEPYVAPPRYLLQWGKLLEGEVFHDGEMKRRVLRTDRKEIICVLAAHFREWYKKKKDSRRHIELPDNIIVFVEGHESHPESGRVINIDYNAYSNLHY